MKNNAPLLHRACGNGCGPIRYAFLRCFSKCFEGVHVRESSDVSLGRVKIMACRVYPEHASVATAVDAMLVPSELWIGLVPLAVAVAVAVHVSRHNQYVLDVNAKSPT